MTLILRDLAGMDEFRQAEALQRAVWGEGDKEDPADLMMVIQAEGGLVAGAFEDGALLGYIFGFPTVTARWRGSTREPRQTGCWPNGGSTRTRCRPVPQVRAA